MWKRIDPPEASNQRQGIRKTRERERPLPQLESPAHPTNPARLVKGGLVLVALPERPLIRVCFITKPIKAV